MLPLVVPVERADGRQFANEVGRVEGELGQFAGRELGVGQRCEGRRCPVEGDVGNIVHPRLKPQHLQRPRDLITPLLTAGRRTSSFDARDSRRHTNTTSPGDAVP